MAKRIRSHDLIQTLIWLYNSIMNIEHWTYINITIEMLRRNEHEKLKIQNNISATTTTATTELMMIKTLCRQAIDSIYGFRDRKKTRRETKFNYEISVHHYRFFFLFLRSFWLCFILLSHIRLEILWTNEIIPGYGNTYKVCIMYR